MIAFIGPPLLAAHTPEAWCWGFVKGVRTYTLTEKSDGTTDFSMVEVLSGVMLPMIGGWTIKYLGAFETG